MFKKGWRLNYSDFFATEFEKASIAQVHLRNDAAFYSETTLQNGKNRQRTREIIVIAELNGAT